MLTLNELKNYLRIDFDSDDILLDSMMRAADASLASSVDDFKAKYEASAATDTAEFCRLADMVKAAIVAELYEHRVPDGQAAAFSYPIRTMVTQLQYYTGDDIKGAENGDI